MGSCRSFRSNTWISTIFGADRTKQKKDVATGIHRRALEKSATAVVEPSAQVGRQVMGRSKPLAVQKLVSFTFAKGIPHRIHVTGVNLPTFS